MYKGEWQKKKRGKGKEIKGGLRKRKKRSEESDPRAARQTTGQRASASTLTSFSQRIG